MRLVTKDFLQNVLLSFFQKMNVKRSGRFFSPAFLLNYETAITSFYESVSRGELNLSKILKTACGFIPMLRFFKTAFVFFRMASKQPLKPHLFCMVNW